MPIRKQHKMTMGPGGIDYLEIEGEVLVRGGKRVGAEDDEQPQLSDVDETVAAAAKKKTRTRKPAAPADGDL